MKQNRENPTSIAEAVEAVTAALLASGFEGEAAELAALATAGITAEDQQALTKLRTMCHVKWLGDLNVQERAWLNLLGKLSDAISAALGSGGAQQGIQADAAAPRGLI